MGIHLDWDVESDFGHSSVEEDAAVVAAQKRRRVITQRALIAAALIVITVGLIAWYRAKIVRDEKLRVLQATVEAEALALRVGDEAKFMKFQGPAEDWRQAQRAHFDQMINHDPQIIVSGKIIELEMTDLEARVVVEMLVNGEVSQGVWLYEYTEKGWRHTDTEQEPFSELTAVSGSFTFTYRTIDQAVVDELTTLLDEWWNIAAERTGVEDAPALAISLDTQVEDIRWDQDRETLLLIPPSAFERDSQYQVSRQRLARLLSEHWAQHLVDTEVRGKDIEGWLIAQLARWLEPAFGGIPEQTSAFTYLSRNFGEGFTRDVITFTRKTGDPADAMNVALAKRAPRQVSHPSYYANYLEAVRTLMQHDFDPQMGPQMSAPVLFADNPETMFSMSLIMLTGAVPDSIVVEQTKVFRGVTWVTASVKVDGTDLMGIVPASGIQPATLLLPFREVDGFSQIVGLRSLDWGANIAQGLDYVTLQYSELDAPYFEDATEQFEADYLAAAQQFGITDPPPITITVMQDLYSQPNGPDADTIMIFSPHQICCIPGMDVWELIHSYYIYQVYTSIFSQQAGEISQTYIPAISILESAIIEVAAARGGHDISLFDGGYEPDPLANYMLPATLDEFWTSSNPTSSAYNDDWWITQIGSRVLIEVLLDRYGDEALIPLTQNVRQISSFEEWLDVSLGITPQEIEAEWVERFHAAVYAPAED